METTISNKKLESTATFNQNEICEIISEIISAYEGKEYVYRQIIEKRDLHVIGDYYYLACIIAKEDYQDKYNSQKIDQLIREGKLFQINRKKVYNWNHINWSSNNFGTHKLKFITSNEDSFNSNIYETFGALRHLPYIIDFIFFCIDYRLQKESQDISYNELINLKNAFLEQHKDMIAEYRQSRIQALTTILNNLNENGTQSINNTLTAYQTELENTPICKILSSNNK